MTARFPKPTEPFLDHGGRVTVWWYNYLRTLTPSDLSAELAAQVAANTAAIQALQEAGFGDFLPATTNVIGQGSVETIGSLAGGLVAVQLAGDDVPPAGNYVYGTDDEGIRGWYQMADQIGVADSIAKTIDWSPYTYLGELPDEEDLPASANVDDLYVIEGRAWVWDGTDWIGIGAPPGNATLSLVNDEETPASSHYYGTDAAGDKGWHPVSDAVEAAAGELTKAVGGDGVTTFGLPDVTPEAGGTLQRYGFDAKGRRIEEEAADTDDLAEGSANLYFTNDRADARIAAQKGQPNGLATLDADAKLEANQLPALAITDTFVVNTEAAMLALDAQQGDVAVRTDEQKSYILTADPASTLANWQELLTPTGTGGTVTSVALSVPTGLTVSGSPITSSGTITVNYDTGYQGYTSAEASKLSGIAAGATVGADWSANLSNIPPNITSWASIDPSSKANDSDVVKRSGEQSNLAGNKSWTGVHEFGSSVVVKGNTFTIDGDANKNFFFRDANGTNRGLIYSVASTRATAIRSYDSSGTVVNGEISVGTQVVVIGTALRPNSDNATTSGAPSSRWSVVYAATGTINTSDAREKTGPRDLTAAEISAAADIAMLPCIFQWLHAIEEKGDGARLHCSPTVQSVIAAMEAHGLDPFRYGFVCYDEWDETPEVKDEETGEVTQEHRPAGDRYSLRPCELLFFIARGQEERLRRLEQALGL